MRKYNRALNMAHHGVFPPIQTKKLVLGAIAPERGHATIQL